MFRKATALFLLVGSMFGCVKPVVLSDRPREESGRVVAVDGHIIAINGEPVNTFLRSDYILAPGQHVIRVKLDGAFGREEEEEEKEDEELGIRRESVKNYTVNVAAAHIYRLYKDRVTDYDTRNDYRNRFRYRDEEEEREEREERVLRRIDDYPSGSDSVSCTNPQF